MPRPDWLVIDITLFLCSWSWSWFWFWSCFRFSFSFSCMTRSLTISCFFFFCLELAVIDAEVKSSEPRRSRSLISLFHTFVCWAEAVLICEWRFRNFWGQLTPTGLSSPFYVSSSLAIERTCFTRGGQPQAWRRRIQSRIAASSSGLSLWKCWLRAEAAFRPLIRSVRVLFGMSCWRASFALEGFRWLL